MDFSTRWRQIQVCSSVNFFFPFFFFLGMHHVLTFGLLCET